MLCWKIIKIIFIHNILLHFTASCILDITVRVINTYYTLSVFVVTLILSIHLVTKSVQNCSWLIFIWFPFHQAAKRVIKKYFFEICEYGNCFCFFLICIESISVFFKIVHTFKALFLVKTPFQEAFKFLL